MSIDAVFNFGKLIHFIDKNTKYYNKLLKKAKIIIFKAPKIDWLSEDPSFSIH